LIFVVIHASGTLAANAELLNAKPANSEQPTTARFHHCLEFDLIVIFSRICLE
jgi:hypothetical protein